jgi:predicted ribosome quality control (RQC) complex YloA/Tae2 family protein
MNIFRVLFLKNWVQTMQSALVGARITDAYVIPNGDMVFALDDNAHIKVVFFSDIFMFTYMAEPFSKPVSYRPCFVPLHGTTITGLHQAPYDRCFYFTCTGGEKVYFTFYGRRSNIIRFGNQSGQQSLQPELARPHLHADLNYTSDQLESAGIRSITFPMSSSAISYMLMGGNPKFPEVMLHQMSDLEDYLQGLLDTCRWGLHEDQTDVILQPVSSFGHHPPPHMSPNDWLQKVGTTYVKKRGLKERKEALLKTLTGKQKQLQKGLEASQKALFDKQHTRPLSEIADLIMANLHMISTLPIPKTYPLFDFYQEKTLEVNIPAHQTGAAYAAVLYKKAKNRHLELHALESKIHRLQQELQSVHQQIQQAEEASHLKSIHRQHKEVEKEEQSLPYKTFFIDGYEARVGKSAKHNDDLLRNFSSKHDLWMHAKDYSGSHLILRMDKNKGKPPPHVIEKAASLAGWYSKGKSQTWLPVMVTERKFVRKGKKLKPGQVIVEKEDVIIVQPQSPQV